MPHHSTLMARLVAVAACSLVAACAASIGTAAQASAAQVNVAAQSGPESGADDIVDDVATAEQVVNGFWSTHWDEHFTGTYRPPSLISAGYEYGIYVGQDGSAFCGSEPLTSDNAFYCPSEDSLAFDASLLGRSVDLGDGFLYLVVAHEWGHAIQARLDEQSQVMGGELQADCFAGAAVAGAVQDGTLVWEDGDSQEISDGLSAVADELPWGESQDHGDAFERVDFFNRGALGGVEACLPVAP